MQKGDFYSFEDKEYMDGIYISGRWDRRRDFVLATVIIPCIEKGRGFLYINGNGNGMINSEIISLVKEKGRLEDFHFINLTKEDELTGLSDMIRENKIVLLSIPAISLSSIEVYEKMIEAINLEVKKYAVSLFGCSEVQKGSYDQTSKTTFIKNKPVPYLFIYDLVPIDEAILATQIAFKDVGFIQISCKKQNSPNPLRRELVIEDNGGTVKWVVNIMGE